MKNIIDYKKQWLAEEARVFKGWDFTSIDAYMVEEALPWDYKAYVEPLINKECKILDMGTGGGELLLSLDPVSGMTFATEAYKANFDYAKDKLARCGVDLRFVESDDLMPFDDDMFDAVINRHEAFEPSEMARILRQDGRFVTQQVGGQNNLEFATELLGKKPDVIDTSRTLVTELRKLEAVGFRILKGQECFPKLRFTSIAAFVYFAKIIQWEFPGFTVERYYSKLLELQKQVDQVGFIEMTEHRFFIEAVRR